MAKLLSMKSPFSMTEPQTFLSIGILVTPFCLFASSKIARFLFNNQSSATSLANPLFFVDYKHPAAIVMVTLCIILVIICVLTFIGLVIYRDHKVIKASSFVFCLLIVSGCSLGALSIFTLVGYPTNVSCMSRPWIMSLSFGLIFS